MKILAKIDEAKDIASKEYIDNLMQSLDSTYQPLITTSNKLAYSLISGTPDLSVYLTTSSASSIYQPKITSSAKLAASLVSGLATVATSGSYNDLSNKPTIPTNTNQLANGAGFITSSASITGNAATASLIKPISGTYQASTWNPLTSYTRIWGESFNVSSLGSDTGDIVFYLRNGVYTSNSEELCVAIDGDFYAQTGSKKVLHEGNYTDYTYSKSQVDSALGGYLPLSGGTITGNLFLKNTYFMWQETTNNYGGYFTGRAFNAHTNGSYTAQIFTWDTDGILTFKSTPKIGSNTIWHSGNDGSGSGLDADLLDGVQLSGLLTSVTSSVDTNMSITVGGITKSIALLYSKGAMSFYTPWNNPTSGSYDLNSHLLGIARYYGSGGTLLNAPSSFGYGSILALSTGTTSLSGQLAWNINHASTTDTTRALYWRAADSSNGYTYAQWHQIAFTDSNVASATKLQTARSIWGQSFDGTSNIKGNLYVYSDTATTINENSGKIVFYSIANTNNLRSPYIQAIHNANYARKRLGFFQSNAANYTDDFVEVLSILPNGNVGVGTTNPTYKLSVNGSIYINGNLSSNYYYFNDVETNPYLRLLHSGSYWYVQAYNGYMYLGVTSVKSCRIDSTGNFLSVGGITSYSDIRKKEKLQDVQLTLKQIADAPLIEHYYKHDDKKTTHVGSIAQYWAGMNDWFCKMDSEGYYTMEIQNAALASAISIARELVKYESKTDRTIRLLKKRINQLEDEIENLKKGA